MRNGSGKEDPTPFCDKPFKAPCGVGGAGGRKERSFLTEGRKDIPIVTIKGLFAVAEDRGDRRGVQDHGKIVRHDVADRAVRTALDGTAADAVPQRDVIARKKGLFLGDRSGHNVLKNRGEHPPEAVMRMPVKEQLFPGFDRGKAAEDQNS